MAAPASDDRPVGFIDSGVGGLTIWRATRKLLPRESLIFLADSGHDQGPLIGHRSEDDDA